MMELKNEKTVILILFFILILVYLLAGIFWIVFGNVWTDENWYFARSYLVTQGKLPYRDFFDFHQPLASLVHALPLYLCGPNLYVGRITSFFFAFLSVLLSCAISTRLAGKIAGLLVLILNIVNLHAFYYASVMAAHTIECFFILSAIYLLMSKNKRPFNYIIAVAVMSLANCTKSLTNLWLWLLLLFILFKEWRNWRIIFLSMITALAVLSCVLLPFILKGGEGYLFGATWHLYGEYMGLPKISIVERALHMIPIIQNYFLSYLLLPTFLIYAWFIRDKKRRILSYLAQYDIITLLGIMVVGHFSVISFFTRYPPGPGYWAFYFPLLTILLSVGIIQALASLKDLAAKRLVKVLITMLILLTPFLQSAPWELVNLKWQKRDLYCVTEVAAKISKYTQKTAKVFTFTPAFAAQADREPLVGMEFEAYAYYPFWSKEKCRRLGLLNSEILIDYLNKKEAKAVVLTQERFFKPTGRARVLEKDLPQLIKAIEANYYLKERLSFPGTFRGDVYIYLAR